MFPSIIVIGVYLVVVFYDKWMPGELYSCSATNERFICLINTMYFTSYNFAVNNIVM